MTEKIQCSKCETRACTVDASGRHLPGEAPSWCPTRTRSDVIERALAKQTEVDRAIARAAAAVEADAYLREPWGLKPRDTRVLEIVNFARKMGYKKLGIVCCFATAWDAGIVTTIFRNRGFEVLVRFCKVHQVKNTWLGIKEEQTLVPGGFQAMCNPITQVDTLADFKCDFIVTFGQCSGHDALAGKYSPVPFTLLGVKDRVLAHNPSVALTCPWSQYYRKLTRKEPQQVVYAAGHYRLY